jgi:lipopolysaccharide export system permease protein
MGGTLYRYTLREMILPFGLGISGFTFVLLLARLIKLTELVVNRGLPAWQIGRLIGLLLPAFLEVTVPMAMLLAILVAFGRLSSDSEMIALRSAGLSLYQLLPSVATFVAAVMVVTACLGMWVRPWSNRALRETLVSLARTNAVAGIRPGTFNDDFPGIVLYAEGVDTASARLTHVLVSDHRDADQQNTVFATTGDMVPDPARHTLTLHLRHGAIHSVDLDGRSSYQTRFESYDVTVDLDDTLGAPSTDADDDHPEDLTIDVLRAHIAAAEARGAPAIADRIEMQRKFAIPFACVVFALVALPLSLQPGRSVRARGLAASLAVIFTYYVLLSTGQALAEQGRLTPVTGLWLANVVLLAAGVVLLRRAGRERPLLPAWIERLSA